MTAQVKVRLKIRKSAVEHMLRSPNGMVGASVHRLGRVAEARAKRNIIRTGRIQTGEMLRTTHTTSVTQHARGVEVSVVSPQPYARFQEDGTVYIKAAHFLRDALDSLSISDLKGA